MGKGGRQALCAKILSVHPLSFLDSAVRPWPGFQGGLAHHVQGALPPAHHLCCGFFPGVGFIPAPAVGYPKDCSLLHPLGGSSHKGDFSLSL